MTVSFSLRRRLPRSPSAAPLEDDDLLSEILLRLPPWPSSLPRASAVCRRWRRLLSDPAFHRRFRIHHRRSPALLGFIDAYDASAFQPALDAPDRLFSLKLPRGLFSLKFPNIYKALGCRHGLALFSFPISLEVVVWDPVAGDHHRLAVPPDFRFHGWNCQVSGAVLRAAGDGDHFRVVLVGSDGKQPRTVLACVYSSETGIWSDCVSTPLPSEGLFIFSPQPALLAGDRLHWSFTVAGSRSILEFDLGRHSLAAKLLPGDMYSPRSPAFTVIRAEGGGIGFLFLYRFIARLCIAEIDCDGVEIWKTGRIIDLDKLLGLNAKKQRPEMIGYAEENNVVFFSTVVGVFMVHLQSLQCKKLLKTSTHSCYLPFETVYTPGIRGGNEGVAVVRHSWWTRWRRYMRQLFW